MVTLADYSDQKIAIFSLYLVNYFRKKASCYMFGKNLNTPLLLVFNALHKHTSKNVGYKNLPHANKLDSIMNFFWPFWPPKAFTKLLYKTQPSTLIQKNVASKKYCINAAMNWHPTRGFTFSMPVKNSVSNPNKEHEKHSRILDGSFLRRLLQKN